MVTSRHEWKWLGVLLTLQCVLTGVLAMREGADEEEQWPCGVVDKKFSNGYFPCENCTTSVFMSKRSFETNPCRTEAPRRPEDFDEQQLFMYEVAKTLASVHGVSLYVDFMDKGADDFKTDMKAKGEIPEVGNWSELAIEQMSQLLLDRVLLADHFIITPEACTSEYCRTEMDAWKAHRVGSPPITLGIIQYAVMDGDDGVRGLAKAISTAVGKTATKASSRPAWLSLRLLQGVVQAWKEWSRFSELEDKGEGELQMHSNDSKVQ